MMGILDLLGLKKRLPAGKTIELARKDNEVQNQLMKAIAFVEGTEERVNGFVSKLRTQARETAMVRRKVREQGLDVQENPTLVIIPGKKQTAEEWNPVAFAINELGYALKILKKGETEAVGRTLVTGVLKHATMNLRDELAKYFNNLKEIIIGSDIYWRAHPEEVESKLNKNIDKLFKDFETVEDLITLIDAIERKTYQ